MKEKRNISHETLSVQEKAAITRNLFERYRRGETSPEENEMVESLETAFIPEKEFAVTDELIAELNAETNDFVYKTIGIEKTKKRRLSPVLVGAAASVALLIIGMLLFNKPADNQVEKVVTETAIKRIALPDGSEITLNVGTSIRYNAAREVWLDEGEAFFDVTPDIENPFTVHLRNGLSVRVLGTSFTVQSYAELPFQQIDVLSGKVTVSAPDNETVELVSDQKATYRATKLSRQTTNAAQKAAWRTGTIVLVNASFAELRLRMRQLYGKNIVFEDVSQNISIHITLHRTAQPLEIADEIAALYGLSYRITPDKIVFQPQK